jgi:hypothetical protein
MARVSDAEVVQAARLALDEATAWPHQAAVLRSRADALDVQITLEMGALAHLQRELAKEQGDVDRYEGLSVPSVIASIIGRREERLATEVSERDALALEIAVRNGALDRLRAQARDLRSQAGHPAEAEQRIQQARGAYLDALHAVGDQRGTQGLELIERIGTIKAAITEITEAQSARADADRALSSAASALSSAGSWSTYDTFFGGGMIADMVKRGHVSDATGAIADAQYAMVVLAAELRDIEWSNPRPAAPQISSSLGTMDLWFDNIFSDWMVRDRISASRQSVTETLKHLAELGGILAAQAAAAETDLQDAESRLADLFSDLTP